MNVTLTICEWYARCDNPADGVVEHPILGSVPTCTRCAEKHDLELVTEEEDEGSASVDPATVKVWGPREGAPGPVHASQPDPHEELSWCGSRRQFRHSIKQGRPVDCKKCLRQLKLGQPKAYGAR